MSAEGLPSYLDLPPRLDLKIIGILYSIGRHRMPYMLSPMLKSMTALQSLRLQVAGQAWNAREQHMLATAI